MANRLDIELTSQRPDGSWTWRAAGAKQPKGSVAASVVPDGVSVGDVLRAEAEQGVDGIDLISLAPPKTRAAKPVERIEVVGSGSFVEGVVENRAKRGRGDRDGDRKRRPKRGGRDGGGRGRSEGRGGERPDDRGDRGAKRGAKRGAGRARADRGRGERAAPPPEIPKRPKPKRLRPGRTHRDRLVAGLPEAERPIAEQLVAGGLPAVRTALKEQNAAAKASGAPEVPAAGVLALADELLIRVRAAEWMDRAEAAVAQMDQVALSDLRSVVSSASGVVRDDATRALVESLRDGLTRREEQAVTEWISDVGASLDVGRVVGALRMASRPPDAKRHLPDELLGRLRDAAAGALSADIAPSRWAVVLDAVSLSPVRRDVTPAGVPPNPDDELLKVVSKTAQRVPQIAALFGVDVTAPPGSAKRRPVPPPPPLPASAEPEPAASAAEPVAETPTHTPAEEPVVEAPTDTPAEEPVAEAPTDVPTDQPAVDETAPVSDEG